MYMRQLIVCCLAGLLLGCATEETMNYQALVPGHLTCEYLEHPSVVDEAQPRLAWINSAREGERGQEQTAWQVRVAGSENLLEEPDLWDSGKQPSMQSTRIKYKGKQLESRQECWWQVRVWDVNDLVSEWSKPAMWRMGLLSSEDWKAQWIGAPWQGEEPIERPDSPNAEPEDMGPPAPQFRKTFQVEKKIESAVAYVSGLGYFEFCLNGFKVGRDVLVPNQTNYGFRPKLKDALIALPDSFTKYKVMYLAYDVKEYLGRGKNTIGSFVGNGFYNPGKFWTEGYGTPRFLCQMHISYTDGTEELVITDTTWKASKGPILMNMVYYGEEYDAREEHMGGCTPEFDDSHWEAAAIKRPPDGKLVAHTAHPDRITERLAPVSITKLGEGHYMVDFGVEISGWVRLNEVDGPAGHKVEIIPRANLNSGKNSYIFRGTGSESYAPRFNWFVFREVEIINWPGELKSEYLIAEAVNTYIEPSATFETSSELFNEINRIWRRSQIDNMHGGIASDCPHRERSGYTGDGQIACNTVLHNYNAKNFYQKWITDMRDAQIQETGYVPNGAPWQPGCGGGPAWGAAICVMPWEFYVQYGSRDMLEDNYQAMKGYVRYLLSWTGKDGIMHSKRTGNDGSIVKWYNLGDWLPPGELIPDEMVHTFVLWYCAHLTSLTAGELGMVDEAKEYGLLAERSKGAFQSRFYDAKAGSYGDAGGNILALKMGVPERQYGRVLKALKEGILKNKGHLDTGILGTRFFFEMLADHGMNQLAFEAMDKRTEPSYGHWIELGSTTTRENWNEDGSHNHPMFGGGLVWLYRNLAGMQADPMEPGYRHIIFKPQPVKELEFVSYTNQTPYGEGGITWRNEEDTLVLELTVPVSCHATAYLPATDPGLITEGGLNLEQADRVTFREMQNGYALVEIESGVYNFRIRMN